MAQALKRYACRIVCGWWLRIGPAGKSGLAILGYVLCRHDSGGSAIESPWDIVHGRWTDKYISLCTSHAYTGDFRKQFFPEKSVNCECGKTMQTHYETQRTKLRKEHHELALPELLATSDPDVLYFFQSILFYWSDVVYLPYIILREPTWKKQTCSSLSFSLIFHMPLLESPCNELPHQVLRLLQELRQFGCSSARRI